MPGKRRMRLGVRTGSGRRDVAASRFWSRPYYSRVWEARKLAEVTWLGVRHRCGVDSAVLRYTAGMRWVLVKTAPNEPMGESWAELLRQNGVPAYVRRETLGVLVYVGSGMTAVRVMVPEDKCEQGKALLDELLKPWDPWEQTE